MKESSFLLAVRRRPIFITISDPSLAPSAIHFPTPNWPCKLEGFEANGVGAVFRWKRTNFHQPAFAFDGWGHMCVSLCPLPTARARTSRYSTYLQCVMILFNLVRRRCRFLWKRALSHGEHHLWHSRLNSGGNGGRSPGFGMESTGLPFRICHQSLHKLLLFETITSESVVIHQKSLVAFAERNRGIDRPWVHFSMYFNGVDHIEYKHTIRCWGAKSGKSKRVGSSMGETGWTKRI